MSEGVEFLDALEELIASIASGQEAEAYEGRLGIRQQQFALPVYSPENPGPRAPMTLEAIEAAQRRSAEDQGDVS